MRLIQPSFEIYEQGPGLEGIYEAIETAGRICYKSTRPEGKTAKDFVDMLTNNKHWAMLEHGTVYLKIPRDLDYKYYKYYDNPYSIAIDGSDLILKDDAEFEDTKYYYITTNLRVLQEHDWFSDLKYLCEPTKFHEKRVSVHFITSIGIGRELLRHRVFSFANESTRYVGYSSRTPITEYNCDSIEDIIKAYQAGFSMREISENSSLSESSIRKRLLDNNVELRGLNNKGNRVEDYFHIIDTPEKAYLLGLIQTDGNIRETTRNASLTITQHKDYAWYIKDMLLDFNSYIGDTKDRNCRQLQIGSKSIVHDLISLGIVPNKTSTQTNENIDTLWQSIPEEYKGDFIRGLIDGDGYVSYFTQEKAVNESCSIGLCSINEHLIDIIIQYIKDKFNYTCGKGKDGNIYKLWITDYKKSVEIGKYLYKHFKYPFGHPKKASSWISRLNENYPIATYKDHKFQLIIPSYKLTPNQIFTLLQFFDFSEDAYTSLRLKGLKPQEAREVLPLATKSELIMTGFVLDWQNFFRLRTSTLAETGKPHPDMSALADPLYKEFIKRGYIMDYPKII